MSRLVGPPADASTNSTAFEVRFEEIAPTNEAASALTEPVVDLRPSSDPGPETGVLSRATRDLGPRVAERSAAALHAAFDRLPAIFGELALSAAATTQEQVRDLIKGFGDLADPKEAIGMLRGAKPHLAEVLSLFGPLGRESELMRDKATALARCHLAVNTDSDPAVRVKDAAEALQLGTSYAKSLGYQTLLQRGDRLLGLRGGGEIELMKLDEKARGAPAETLLRQIGRALNERHFQNPTIVPPDRINTAPASREYQSENAYWCSHLSMLAYAEPDDARALAAAWGFKEVRFVEDAGTDTQAIVVSGDKGVFVAFRGTSNFADFKTDVGFRKTSGFGGSVHSGFKKSYDSVAAKLAAAVAEIAQDRPVFFTGHSLGGAQAQLAALDLAGRGVEVASVYTYGAPRVGDGAFAAAYNAKLGEVTFHHVNNKDAVARVPPMMFGYADTGYHRFTFDGDGEMTRDRTEARARSMFSLESTMERAPDPLEAQRLLAEAVAAIAAEPSASETVAAGGAGALGAAPGLESARAMALEGLFSPMSDHYNRNYLRLTCEQLRRSL